MLPGATERRAKCLFYGRNIVPRRTEKFEIRQGISQTHRSKALITGSMSTTGGSSIAPIGSPEDFSRTYLALSNRFRGIRSEQRRPTLNP